MATRSLCKENMHCRQKSDGEHKSMKPWPNDLILHLIFSRNSISKSSVVKQGWLNYLTFHSTFHLIFTQLFTKPLSKHARSKSQQLTMICYCACFQSTRLTRWPNDLIFARQHFFTQRLF